MMEERSTHRILLVDNDKESLIRARGFLESEGFEVIACNAGRKAIDYATYIQFDLLMTNALLTQVNGRDLATRIGHSLPGIKVLFMSPYSMEALIFHGICPCGSEFLLKPFEKSQVVAKVEQVLEQAPPWKTFLGQGHTRLPIKITDDDFLHSYSGSVGQMMQQGRN